jgi:hypothetical protein
MRWVFKRLNAAKPEAFNAEQKRMTRETSMPIWAALEPESDEVLSPEPDQGEKAGAKAPKQVGMRAHCTTRVFELRLPPHHRQGYDRAAQVILYYGKPAKTGVQPIKTGPEGPVLSSQNKPISYDGGGLPPLQAP